MSPVQFLFLLSRQSVANLSRITSKAWRDAGGIPPLQEPNGVDGVDFLGRVVTPERIERERSIERKKRKHVEKLGGDRKSDQDLESGLVFFDEQERDQSLCLSACDGSNPKQWLNP